MKLCAKILVSVTLYMPVIAMAQTCALDSATGGSIGLTKTRIWSGDAPQSKGKGCEDVPTLTVFDPTNDHPNGSAVIVFPGGSYAFISQSLEGRQVADWFTSRGFRAFMLTYRLTSNGYVLPVPLLDARRAVQYVRANAAAYHVDADRIGIIGFSAGGHLAALAATQPVPGDPASNDPIERVSSKPNFLVLAYPWIGALDQDTSHLNYCVAFHLEARCDELRKAYSPDLFVTKDTPATFWYHTADDQTVPLAQGLRFYQALVQTGVPAEAHIFEHGAHGSGLGAGDPALDAWPSLLENWLRGQGMMGR